VTGSGAFIAEMGGFIVVMYFLFYLVAKCLSARCTWVHGARSQLVEKLFKIEYTGPNSKTDLTMDPLSQSEAHLYSDSDKLTLERARRSIENRAKFPPATTKQNICAFMKCFSLNRREKLIARGLKVIEKELEIEKVLKRNR
jgi:hypothetical protein